MESELDKLDSDNVDGTQHDFADFVVRNNRIHFVELFNKIAGTPSAPLHALQEEFVEGSMEEIESGAFIEVCKGLMAATSATGRLPV